MEYYEWKNKVSLEHSEEIKEEINKLNSIYNECKERIKIANSTF